MEKFKEKVSISHRIREDVYSQFCEIADSLGVKKSAIITSLLMQWNKTNKGNTIFIGRDLTPPEVK
jgi:hypothetical protein